MIRDMESLLEGYWAWLRDQTSLRTVEGWVEVTTPYLDRHNDCIQIYVKRDGDGYLLSDDGYVLDDLEHSGLNVNLPRHRALIDVTLNGFGVQKNGTVLETRASASSFGVRKHNFLQAMLAVDDISYLAKPGEVERPPFLDSVAAWLDDSRVRYTPNISLTGRSGYGHRFEFVIPKSDARPERVVRAFNRPNRTVAQNMVFSWIDTKKARVGDSHAYAILNDDGRQISDEVMFAMREYEVVPIPWSQREAALSDLAV